MAVVFTHGLILYHSRLQIMELATNQKNESKPSKKSVSSSTNQISSYPFPTVRSMFIGSVIHDHSFDSREKHRPSKRARQRIKKRLAKLELEGIKAACNQIESGYDTTSGDCQTPGLSSPEKTSFKLLENNKPNSNKKQLPSDRNSQPAAEPEYSKSTILVVHVLVYL